jgi:hypothetical protein
LGIIATLAANVAHGLGHGIIGAAVAAWPAAALVGSYELFMMVIRSGQRPSVTPSAHDDDPATDPLGDRAAIVFADDLASNRVPSIRAIRAALHVGQPRAQRLRGHLAIIVETHGGKLADNQRDCCGRNRQQRNQAGALGVYLPKPPAYFLR